MSYIKLDRLAFKQNIDYFKSQVKDPGKLSIGLKDNAYGHGLLEMAGLAKDNGIRNVFVRGEREVNQLQDFEFSMILVLSPFEYHYQREDVVYVVNDLEQLKKIPKATYVELKIDTGMHRNGILPQQLAEAVETIEARGLYLGGVMTHFSCADEAQSDVIYEQEEQFQKIVKELRSLVKNDFRVHCANSAAVSRIDLTHYDLVRLGIGAYGYSEFPEVQKHLKPVLSLYAQKVSQRTVVRGERLGYGSHAYIVEKDETTVSNYDIGYGDGFLRLSEDKKATIADGRPILGRVSMDSFLVEGTDEEICVFDNAKNLAKVHQTIVYEITTQLSPFLKRVVG